MSFKSCIYCDRQIPIENKCQFVCKSTKNRLHTGDIIYSDRMRNYIWTCCYQYTDNDCIYRRNKLYYCQFN